MIRVLQIFHNMGNGGVEAFVMNNYRKIDREKIQFDFLTSVDEPGYFDEEIKALGGRIFRAYPLKKNPFRNYHDIARIVRENDYQIVHRHTGSAFGYFDLRAAKKGGAKCLILHSHNPAAGKSWVHRVSKRLLEIDCTRLACSDAAGLFLFGNKEFTVMPNAIDCDKYQFSAEARNLVRTEWQAKDAFVIGHIGRLEEQKNHKRLVEIFSAVLKKNEKSILVCVGDGSLRQSVEAFAKQLGVFDKIRFLGTRNDVGKLINGFDVFCFPSNYEGFGITLIEAQANGLHCYTSKAVVPGEANLAGNVHFIPLTASDEEWADLILKAPTERDLSAIDRIKDAGYSIDQQSNKLIDFYEQCIS